MLTRKQVSISNSEIQLWDEGGRFIGSYDRTEDVAMCDYLIRMVELGDYQLRGEHPASASLEPMDTRLAA